MNKWLFPLAFGLLINLAACSPTTNSTVTPTPTAIAPTVTTTNAAPAVNPVDITWSKLVDSARKENKLTIYSFSFTGDTGIVLQQAFKKKYGIPVEIITGRGAEMLERLKTEKRTQSIVADMMEGSPTHATNLKVAGLTISSLDIPALRDKEAYRVDPLVNDREGHLLGHRVQSLNPWINANLVRPGEGPKSYKELLLPKWQGKYVLPDAALTSGNYQLFMTLVRNKLLDLDTLRQIGKNAKFVLGARQVAEAVAKGEYPFGVPAMDSDAAPFIREGAPLRPSNMEEGTLAITSVVVAVKDGPHPSTARLFIDWMLSQEGQSTYVKSLGLSSVRKDVQDFRPEAARFVPLRIVPYGMDDATDDAKLMREEYLKNLWK